jgi:hypothetical protein
MVFVYNILNEVLLMQKSLSAISLLCIIAFAAQTEASESQQRVVDVHARLIKVPFIGQSGMIIPGLSQNGIHLRVPIQDIGMCQRQTYADIKNHLEHVYPGSEAIAFNIEDHDAYFADVLLDVKLPYEAQIRKKQTREFAYLLSLAAIYQALLKHAVVDSKKKE